MSQHRDKRRARTAGRTNPLPIGEWVELTTQLDTADDARGRFLTARPRPFDATGSAISRPRPIFPSSPSEAFTTYLDRRLADAAREDGAARLAITLDEACTRLAVERPIWWECVDLCCRQVLTERDVAARLDVSPALAHRRKVRGLEQLAVWCDVEDAGIVALLLRHRRSSRAS